MTVKDLDNLIGPHLATMPVVFITEEYAPEGFPEWMDCYVRVNRQLKRLEIVLREVSE